MTSPTPPDAPAWDDPVTEAVAPGVHRIPMPLPGDGLKAVNVYALAHGESVTLIDSGWALGDARPHLETSLGELGYDLGMVDRILVTHVHRDHYELAIHLRALYGPTIALGIGEQPSLTSLLDPPPPEVSPMRDRLAQAGAHQLLQWMAEARERRQHDPIRWELPDTWLRGGTAVAVGERSLEVVPTPGHTQGHVVFLDRRNGLLFSGDHVLPHITPSIGFEQLPVRSALADYLESLDVVASLPDVRMLPAHGPTQPAVHERLAELREHHEVRLRLSLDAVRGGATTAFEVAHDLPWTSRDRAFVDLDVFNQMLAVNETIAHLDVLVDRGDLDAAIGLEDVERYSVPPGSERPAVSSPPL